MTTKPLRSIGNGWALAAPEDQTTRMQLVTRRSFTRQLQTGPLNIRTRHANGNRFVAAKYAATGGA